MMMVRRANECGKTQTPWLDTGVTKEADEMAIQRMIQAGAVPMTWLQVMLEWQRDWARQGTYERIGRINGLFAPPPRERLPSGTPRAARQPLRSARRKA